jgi:hypothetical protein
MATDEREYTFCLDQYLSLKSITKELMMSTSSYENPLEPILMSGVIRSKRNRHAVNRGRHSSIRALGPSCNRYSERVKGSSDYLNTGFPPQKSVKGEGLMWGAKIQEPIISDKRRVIQTVVVNTDSSLRQPELIVMQSCSDRSDDC